VSAYFSPKADNSSKRKLLPGLILVLAGLLALGVGIYVALMNEDARGRSAGALFGVALPDAAGREQSFGQWKGKVLVVNFWATWCVPCRDEMPEFVKAQREFGDRGVQFVGIAADDAAKVKAFADELGLNYPALIGGYGAIELSRTLGNRMGALPYTIFIDRSGRISRTQLGPIKPDELRSIVGQMLG
jgi:thiol-disulfide isomerase/thioredoxin